MARGIRTPLEYKDHPIDLLKEATDMHSTAAAYRQSLDDLMNQSREQGIRQGREQGIRQGREQGIRQGREQGIRHGEKQSLVRLATLKFGRDAGEAFSNLVGSSRGADLDGLAAAILESESASALLDRARNLPGQAAP